MTTSPFFLIGCARSGTTLLRTMLNHHPEVAIPPESFFLIDYLQADPETPLSTVRQLLAREYELTEWNLHITTEHLEDCTSIRETINRVYDTYRQKHGKVIWGHKTTTFVHLSHVLKAAYPQARFIHIIRDPRAVASSLIQSNVHRSNTYFASRRWILAVTAGLRLKNQYPQDVLEISYENLVSCPELTLTRVCRFLGVEFSPEMLVYYQTGGEEYGRFYREIHAKLCKPPDPASIDRWRTFLSPKDVALVEACCGSLMEHTGYNVESHRGQIDPTYLAYLKCEHVWGATRRVVHSITTRPGYSASMVRRRLGLSLPRKRSFLSEAVWYIIH